MFQGFPAGRVTGIAVGLHPALVLVLVYWALVRLVSPEPVLGLLHLAIFACVLLVSVLVHELGHCYAARRVGGSARSIQLGPFGGLAEIAGAERSPFHEFLIVLPGPMVSLGLALAATGLVAALPDGVGTTPGGGLAYSIAIEARDVNWMLFIFNMATPIFPLDCARLLRSVGSTRWSPERVTHALCFVGIFFSGALAALYIIGLINPFPWSERFGILTLLIALFGVQTCLLGLRGLENSLVYSDFDGERVKWRQWPSRLRETLVGPGGRPWRRGSGSSSRGTFSPMRSERERLEEELEQAVGREDFVRAAEIRDRLKRLMTQARRS